MANRSRALSRFLRSLEAPITSREQLEGLDMSALEQLEGAERDEAESRLIERLERDPDERVVRALGSIPTDSATQALRDAIPRYRGGPDMVDSAAFEALKELIRRGDEPRPVDALLDALANGGPRTRAGAAEALVDYPEERVTDGLLERLRDDDEHGVRRAAANALFHVSGLGPWADVWYTPIWLLKHWLTLPWPSVQEPAIEELEELVEKKRAGQLAPPPNEIPPESPELTRFLDSMLCEPGQEPFPDDFDLEALEELEGIDRDRVEFALIKGLEGNDPRYPRAVAAMGSERAVDPLEAHLETSDGDMKAAIEAAIETLDSQAS